jgi:hypothetical protein
LQENKDALVGQNALIVAKGIPIPKDFEPEINQVNANLNTQIKSVNDYLYKTLPQDIKRIGDLDNRETTDTKQINTLISNIREQLAAIQVQTSTNAERSAIIVNILQNQDRILRVLVPDSTNYTGNAKP